MNKADLIRVVASQVDFSMSKAEEALNAVLGAITSALSAGETVATIGFGSFSVRHRNERKGRNPQTGEEITILASNLPTFKPGKALRDAVS